MAKERLVEIDRAKGLAIFLVVLGHLFSFANNPEKLGIYFDIRIIIYTFHMSLFTFLSGFIMFYKYKPLKTFSDYKKYILKRFWRLMPAYFLFSLAVLIAKITAQGTGKVDNAITSLSDVYNVILAPTDSFSRFLWYIYVLFIFYVIVPPLLRLSRQKLWPLFLIGIAIYFLPRTHFLAIGSIESYLSTFILGGILAKNRNRYETWLNKWGILCFGLFLIALMLVRPLNIAPFPTSVAPLRLIVGLLSIPAIHWLMKFEWTDRFNILTTLGKYTFPIYLLNTLAIGAAKAILAAVTSFEGFHLLWISLCLLLVGLYGPIIIKSLFFSRLPALDRITN